MILGIIIASAAMAMTPPAGWHPQSESRALLNPNHPEYGELREYALSQGDCSPQLLSDTLHADQFPPLQFEQDTSGAVDLVFADRVGRARCVQTTGGPLWAVVIAAPQSASSLDPESLLAALLPAPSGPSWGAEPTPKATGPWPSQETTESSEWLPIGTEQNVAWERNPDLLGNWEGTTFPDLVLIRYLKVNICYLVDIYV